MKVEPLIEILKLDFEKRKKRNKTYSLRSYSRDLEIDASNLSKLLSYQKSLGTSLKLRLAAKLGFSDSDFESIAGNFHSNTEDVNYSEHVLRLFELISKSYHYVILELFKTSDFDSSPESIARAIGISHEEVCDALGRLENVGLLSRGSDGTFEPSEDSSSSILGQATSRSHREQQKEILEGAIDALQNTSIDERSQSSMTMAIDTSKLDEARKLIKTFRRKMGRLLSDSKDLDRVYQLSISLYPASISKSELK